MKLVDKDVEIISSPAQETMTYGIKNVSHLMGLLIRYNNPIQSIVREISANAIDANREAKKSSSPIKIVLPSQLNGSISFEDCGPGISPGRMKDVFGMIGESTKRDSNILQGGFGIGAKSPFGYTDQFFVETTVDGIKYFYKMYKKNGFHIDKVKEEATNDGNGTKVIIPVQKGHHYQFNEAVRYYGRLWEVPPEIIGGAEISRVKPKLYGNGWIYCPEIQDANILVDNIPYNAKSIKVRPGLLFTFGNGELQLVPTREDIIEDDDFKAIVAERTKNALEEFTKEIKKEAKAKKSILELQRFIDSTFRPEHSEPNEISIEWQGKHYTCHRGSLPDEVEHYIMGGKTINSIRNVVEIPRDFPCSWSYQGKLPKMSTYKKGILNGWLKDNGLTPTRYQSNEYCYVYEGDLPELPRTVKLKDLKKKKGVGGGRVRKWIEVSDNLNYRKRMLINAQNTCYYVKHDSKTKGVWKLVKPGDEKLLANTKWVDMDALVDELETKLKSKKLYKDYELFENLNFLVSVDPAFKADYNKREHEEIFKSPVFKVLEANKRVVTHSFAQTVIQKYPMIQYFLIKNPYSWSAEDRRIVEDYVKEKN